jgi:hypothetical protein
LREITNIGFGQLNTLALKTFSENLEPKEQLLQLSIASWDFALNNKELYQLMFSLERPTTENANKGMDLLKGVFVKITGKNEEEVDSLVLNWICLRLGCINFMLNFHGGPGEEDGEMDSRDLYIEFIKRFISSII